MLGLTTLLIVGLLQEGAFGQNRASSNSLQAEIERLHTQWFTAFDKGDGAAMDQMELPNLILVGYDGKRGVWQKEGPRAGKQQPTGYSSRVLSNTIVRQFGDTVILTGMLTSKTGTKTERASETVVWIRQNNRWLIASAHWTFE
jgi:ketosteroid isomerase-like protein